MPQKTICDAWTKSRLEEAFAEGATNTEAAAAARVNPSTLRSWLQKGEKEGAIGVYRDLAAAVTRARDRGRESVMVKLHAAGEKDWRAYDAYLKHRNAGKDRELVQARILLTKAQAALMQAKADLLGSADTNADVLAVLMTLHDGEAGKAVQRH